MKTLRSKLRVRLALVCAALGLTACTAQNNTAPQLPSATVIPSLTNEVENYKYLIGPGDSLSIFVWLNPEISGSFIVRPDGMITTSLVEDIPVSGKTPSEVAREVEAQLQEYIRDPIVTVTVGNFVGPYSEQVRIIGEASAPQAISYRENMTLLDVMVQVGGLSEFADGNSAKLVRVVGGAQQTYNIRISELIQNGNIDKNVDMLPGDIVIIPEAWF
ncbi:sugar ABC transporter substrate-binding protein [Alginatibacterium sediminis]|uniref:Sugar ABC transporter substrate-binding protein n=1 Tax=Alginatibacterium sediminis TaxID=2164068 RepID=A0A420E7K8_9ALTE|nr:XrtA/PEP-CTERM system exopolysaccharide export protein [Alginatibacterium sediminis]RKF14399.1 sugar ABC transporter substrate-binding protein [Alginatibacterium sediminis]